MALQEAILKSLQSATTANDAQRLKDAYSAIIANLNGQTGQRAGLESLVVCAETALKVGLTGPVLISTCEGPDPAPRPHLMHHAPHARGASRHSQTHVVGAMCSGMLHATSTACRAC